MSRSYVCSLHVRSQQKCWLQDSPAPEPAMLELLFVSFDEKSPVAYLWVVEVNDGAIILDHVHLLNAGNIVH